MSLMFLLLLGIADLFVMTSSQTRRRSGHVTKSKSRRGRGDVDVGKLGLKVFPGNTNTLLLQKDYAHVMNADNAEHGPIIMDAIKHGLVPVKTFTVFSSPDAGDLSPTALHLIWTQVGNYIKTEPPTYTLNLPFIFRMLSQTIIKEACQPEDGKKCPPNSIPITITRYTPIRRKNEGRKKHRDEERDSGYESDFSSSDNGSKLAKSEKSTLQPENKEDK